MCNDLLAYIDINNKFYIHTDASYSQLGVVIIQGGRTISIYSEKLNGPHTSYMIMEK